jgi:hypothetical protein
LVDRRGSERSSAWCQHRGAVAEQLFAVVLLWDTPEVGAGAWIGWLTALDHRSVCFCVADLENARFRQWLADLPGWTPEPIARALASPGLHLVWRRSAD